MRKTPLGLMLAPAEAAFLRLVIVLAMSWACLLVAAFALSLMAELV